MDPAASLPRTEIRHLRRFPKTSQPILNRPGNTPCSWDRASASAVLVSERLRRGEERESWIANCEASRRYLPIEFFRGPPLYERCPWHSADLPSTLRFRLRSVVFPASMRTEIA